MRELFYEAEVEIEGLTPLIHHKNDVAQLKSTPHDRSTDWSEEWKQTTYLSMDGGDQKYAIIPVQNMQAMLRDFGQRGGKKIGRESLKNILNGGLDIVDFEIPIHVNGGKITLEDIEKNKWILEAPVRIGKDRVPRSRTMLPIGWNGRFTIRITDKRLTPQLLEMYLENAGWEMGLMDWRPGAPKPGSFGRFSVKKFKVKN